MPAWRRETEALIASALGAPPAVWIDWGETLPATGAALPNVVLALVEHAPLAAERTQALVGIRAALAARGRLIVVDHNRPRRTLAALSALVGAPWVVGTSLQARWQRPAYPAAREVQAAGYDVERLLLTAAERIQIVVGVKREA